MDTILPLIEHAPLAGLFVLLVLGGLGLPFPEDATLILTGALIGNRAVPPLPALAVVYAGILAADVLLHRIGGKYGRTIVTHRRFHRMLPPARLTRLEERFSRSGFLFVLIGRHVIGLRPQVFLVAGIMRMPLGAFLAADALSALGSIALMVGIGYAGGNSLDVLRRDVTRIEHAGVVVAAAAVLIVLTVRYVRSWGGKSESCTGGGAGCVR